MPIIAAIGMGIAGIGAWAIDSWSEAQIAKKISQPTINTVDNMTKYALAAGVLFVVYKSGILKKVLK